MKYELGEVYTMTPREVAEQMINSTIGNDERIADAFLNGDGELEIDIETIVGDDPRCDGDYCRTEFFHLSEIQDMFTHGDYYTWAEDENGDDVLLCFGV